MLRRGIAGKAIENFDLTVRAIGDRLRASSSRFCARLSNHRWPAASDHFALGMRASLEMRSSERNGVGFRASAFKPAGGTPAGNSSDYGCVGDILPVAIWRVLAAALLVAACLGARPLAATPVPQGNTPATVRVGGDVKPPLKTKTVAPVYPPIAVAAHTEGVVILEATIGTDGKVKDVKVVRSIKTLDDAAMDAVRRWEFKPTVIDGKPVQVIMTIPVNFTLP
jgi:TonB family protein